MTTSSLRSNVVIVTGASRGIGAATSLLAARLGCTVCVNDVRNENAARTVTDSILDTGGRAVSVQADVSEEADVERLFATCRSADACRRHERRQLYHRAFQRGSKRLLRAR
ncbi:MAG: SDR family NAD(P)-dependent oxidoreductase [Steroidobacteraceae bacterium]